MSSRPTSEGIRFEALWDLADRIGMREEMNQYYNVYFSSFGGEALISGDIASVRDVKMIDPKKVTDTDKT